MLRHDITHLAAAADTADITPRWLVEGFAATAHAFDRVLHETRSAFTAQGRAYLTAELG